MPDTRTHRGPDARDEILFEHRRIMDLKAAVLDMSTLLSRGYGEKATIKLVGDRYRLVTRQRLAVMRGSCSDRALFVRERSRVRPHQIHGQTLAIDGYNILITVESLLAGGYVFIGRDSCYRDIASIHSTYRRVEETIPAIKLICQSLVQLKANKVKWYFDQPVSNSGKLKVILEQFFEKNKLNWAVDVVANPDSVLKKTEDVVVSSDSVILDNCLCWMNLAEYIVKEKKIGVSEHIIDLH